MATANAQFMAAGNIYPSRFVKIYSANKVTQASTNEETEGISQEGTNYPPITDSRITVAGYAAVSGEAIRVYQDGEVCTIEAGGSFSAGGLLKSDSNGKAVAVATSGTTIQYFGAEALDDSTGTGQLVRVKVRRGHIRPAVT